MGELSKGGVPVKWLGSGPAGTFGGGGGSGCNYGCMGASGWEGVDWVVGAVQGAAAFAAVWPIGPYPSAASDVDATLLADSCWT